MSLIQKLDLEFHKEMESLEDKSFGLAVSGGGDSIALLVLASKWAKINQKCIKVVTVNHNLRKEAKDEANFTNSFSQTLGLNHTILEWTKPHKRGNLQSEAAFARKKLISNWAKLNTIKTVLLAHSLDDQVETILMRLARGSGVDGLAGMNKSKFIFGIKWYRPLLNVTRIELRNFLKLKKVSWVEDPTNQDKKFLRVKSRDVITQLNQIGINTNLLINTSLRMQNAKQVLNDVAAEATIKFIKLKKWGDLELNKDIFLYSRNDTILRILAGIICMISGNIYRPRYSELFNFAEALKKKKFKARTLGGVLARSLNEQTIVLRREPSFPKFIFKIPSNNFTWDNRWQVSILNKLKNNEKVGPLGVKGLLQIKKNSRKSKYEEGFLSTPTLYSNEEVISCPILNFGEGLTCKLIYSKKQFINSFILH